MVWFSWVFWQLAGLLLFLIMFKISLSMNPGSLAASYVVAILIVFGLTGTSLFLRFLKKDKTNLEKHLKLILKISGLLLIFSFMLRYLLSDDPYRNTFALTNGIAGDNRVANGFIFIIIFLYVPAILIAFVRPFFELKSLRVLNKFFSLPFSILSLIFLFVLAYGYNSFSNIPIINWTVVVLLAIEVGAFVSTCVTAFLLDYKKDNTSNTTKKEIGYIIAVVAIVLVFGAPAHSLQYLFGSYRLGRTIIDISVTHRIFIYAVIVIPIIFYIIHSNRSDEERRMVMILISVACLITFATNFKLTQMFLFLPTFHIDYLVLPLHLCHTAMYIVPFCIIFRKQKLVRNLFYFTYFINVFGALAAILMPNYSEAISGNLFSPNLWVFWINHFDAMIMPLLAVALRIFNRPKFKYMAWSLLFFAIYYISILFINVWFSNYAPSVDYFFLNSNFISEKFGTTIELAIMKPWSFTINDLVFRFYPIYQVLFFSVYILVAFLMWYVYEIGFKIADSFNDIFARQKIIKKEKLQFLATKKNIVGGEQMENKNKIELIFKDFSKRYGNSDVYSASDINLEIHGGEIFGFLGPNGAGKSTCIKTAIGIQPITSGSITVCGYDVKTEPVQAKKMIGYVPDHYALYEKLTGREYINYIADLYGVSQEDRDIRIAKYIDLFELYQAFDNRMQTYSHGMKQKIAIIAALVHNPKIWILDEPLTGLDPNSIFQVKECMKDHANAGNIVFFSSHIIDVVEKLCDRIAIIKKGKILVVSSVKEIEKKGTLEDYYMKLVEDSGDSED